MVSNIVLGALVGLGIASSFAYSFLEQPTLQAVDVVSGETTSGRFLVSRNGVGVPNARVLMRGVGFGVIAVSGPDGYTPAVEWRGGPREFAAQVNGPGPLGIWGAQQSKSIRA